MIIRLFSWAALIAASQCRFESSLNLHYLSDEDSLAEFRFDIVHDMDFTEVVQEQQVFSRSFLENFHVHAGVRQAYISATQGRIKNFNKTIVGRLNQQIKGNMVYTPNHGTLIISNSDADETIMINQLSEIFRIAKKNVQKDPTYSYILEEDQDLLFRAVGFEDGINIGNKVFLAQDPTDNVCIDGIEKLKEFLGCKGRKGIMALIDQVPL